MSNSTGDDLFPKFKKLELIDLSTIEQFSKKFEPYSNFGFSSLYTWNTDNKTSFSFLNDNLVIKRKDYIEDKQIYSLLGRNKLDETVAELLKITDELKLVPNVVAIGLTNSKSFEVLEDENNHDYVLSIDDIVHLNGGSFANKRYLVNKAKRLHDDFSLVKLNLNDPETYKTVFILFDKWAEQKQGSLSKEDEKNERIAIHKLFNLSAHIKIIALGLYINGMFAGFFCSDIQNEQYTTGLFLKGDISFKNVYDLLFYESLKYLNKQGYKYYNFEMDLGLPGLRYFKTSWRPVTHLKHYLIRRK